ncbi:MAG: hypothetical protein JO142_09970 [Burkholderiales bacterium]|nr:hypothetical protein [Burkholderiales bacterium]
MTPRLLRNAILLPALLVAGCGFHLRGTDDTSTFPFASLAVTTTPGGLGDVVQRQMSVQRGVKIVPAAQAEAVLNVETETIDKQILTVNNSGRVSEYLLIYHARFSLRRGNTEWIPRTQITVHRDYSFDPNNPTGIDSEEQLLIRDMRLDATQQIFRRLAAARQPVMEQPVGEQPAATPEVKS